MRGAMGLVFRASLRQGWRSLLGIAVLIGVTGGAVLLGAEVARRTDTAYDRMRHDTDAWDVLVNPDSGFESQITLSEVAALPEVAQVAQGTGLIVTPYHLHSLSELDLGPIALAGCSGRVSASCGWSSPVASGPRSLSPSPWSLRRSGRSV